MIRATVLSVCAVALTALGASDSIAGSTLLTPGNQVRTVYPGDSWSPPVRERTAQLLSRVTATRRYADVGVPARLMGRAERRAFRHAMFLVSLEDDRARMFTDYGMPSYRGYENHAGREREVWTYELVGFSAEFEGNRLVNISYW